VAHNMVTAGVKKIPKWNMSLDLIRKAYETICEHLREDRGNQ